MVSVPRGRSQGAVDRGLVRDRSISARARALTPSSSGIVTGGVPQSPGWCQGFGTTPKSSSGGHEPSSSGRGVWQWLTRTPRRPGPREPPPSTWVYLSPRFQLHSRCRFRCHLTALGCFCFVFAIFSFLRLFFSLISVWKVPSTCLQTRRLSPGPVPPTHAHGAPRFCRGVFLSGIFFQFFLPAPASLLTSPICSSVLPVFPISARNILIIVILNSPPDRPNICVASESGSDDLFVCSGCAFPGFLARLVPCGKPGTFRRARELESRALGVRLRVDLPRSWAVLHV